MGRDNYYTSNQTPPDGINSREDVIKLQRELNKNGANLVVDGIYGDKTNDAYKQQVGSSSGSGSGGSSGRSSGGSSGGHKSGYVGPVITGRDGNSYTDYGALLREDGFYYPEGAKISPNGMYFDIGNGWQFAKYGVAFDGGGHVLGYTPTSMTYAAPGTRVSGFEGAYTRSSGSQTGDAPGDDAASEEEELSIWEKFYDEQRKKNEEELYGSYSQ